MKKNYVLDTNVLIYDPQSIFRFDDNNVIIPIFCIEEVDRFKGEGSERGRNARHVARMLDELREGGGSLATGVPLKSGGTLRVMVPTQRLDLSSAMDREATDAAILQAAILVANQDPYVPTILVTMDTNLRIRGDAHGLPSQTYENMRVEVDTLDTGVRDLAIEGEDLDDFFRHGKLVYPNADGKFYENVCVMLRDAANPSHSALARYSNGTFQALRVPREGLSGIKPRNREQSFALDLLLDDSIRLVTLLGKAGTGKTLLALAAGLRRTVEDGIYTRMLVSRPVMPLGRDIGFLPGDISEKMNPWMQPIFDNLEFLYSNGRKGSKQYMELIEQGLVQVEPLTYIRGRSLPQQYIIVDEAQNLTPHEIKTIVTRSGDGTKIVLTGDPNQIDNPYVDAASNGLTIAADKFRGQRIAGHIQLTKGERSELAEIATNLL
jgi:PhoH-like ATPase